MAESTGVKVWVHKRDSELANSAQNIIVTVYYLRKQKRWDNITLKL